MASVRIQNNYTLNRKISSLKLTNRYLMNKKAVKSDKVIGEVKYLCTMYKGNSSFNVPITAFNYNESITDEGDLTGNLQLSIPYPESLEMKENVSLISMDSTIVRQYRDFTDGSFESFFVSFSTIDNGNYQLFRNASNLNLNCSVNTLSDAQLETFKNNNSELNWTNNDELTYIDKIVSRQTTNEGDILFEVPSIYFTRAGKYFVYNGQQYYCKRLGLWISRSGSTVQLLGRIE